VSVEEQNGGVTPNREVDAASDRSFDALAKGLANGSVSRRKALKLMGGALLGGVLASIPGVALAAPQPGKGPCQPGQFQCGKKCCPSEASCVRGECVCPAPKTVVGGACVCPTNTTCTSSGGTLNANCECVCPTHKTLVGGACVCPSNSRPCGTRACCFGEEICVVMGGITGCCRPIDPGYRQADPG
jgi:hypothetical protein